MKKPAKYPVKDCEISAALIPPLVPYHTTPKPSPPAKKEEEGPSKEPTGKDISPEGDQA